MSLRSESDNERHILQTKLAPHQRFLQRMRIINSRGRFEQQKGPRHRRSPPSIRAVYFLAVADAEDFVCASVDLPWAAVEAVCAFSEC